MSWFLVKTKVLKKWFGNSVSNVTRFMNWCRPTSTKTVPTPRQLPWCVGWETSLMRWSWNATLLSGKSSNTLKITLERPELTTKTLSPKSPSPKSQSWWVPSGAGCQIALDSQKKFKSKSACSIKEATLSSTDPKRSWSVKKESPLTRSCSSRQRANLSPGLPKSDQSQNSSVLCPTSSRWALNLQERCLGSCATSKTWESRFLCSLWWKPWAFQVTST